MLNRVRVHVDVLPGFQWARNVGRYRDLSSGRFVSRRNILSLLSGQQAATEAHFSEITTAFYEGKISAAVWQEQMRTGIRRAVLQQEALGAGGWDRLGPRQFGRAGRDLRDQYAKIAGNAADILDGKVTLPQALARVREVAGNARSHFYAAERETVQRSSTGMVLIERRVITAGADNCEDCLEYYERGWQLEDTLPPPATDSRCRGNCLCQLLRREVPANEVGEWIGTKR